MKLSDLALTPTQHTELQNHDPTLIDAWLTALNTTPGIKSPTGWLLAGIRTGKPPADLNTAHERQAIQKAERLLTNIGANIHTEPELLQTLFAPADLTADTATLEHTHTNLTGETRALLAGTITAQLAYTQTHGRQPVPDTGGPLRHHDTPALRQRMTALWRQQRDRIEHAERAAYEQARHRADLDIEATEPELTELRLNDEPHHDEEPQP